MITLRRVLSASVLLSLLTFVIAGPADSSLQDNDSDPAADLEEFQKLLDQVDPPSLHAALHDFSPKKFKHGMFQQDRTAVEVIHRDNAPLATTIVSIAKRQSPNISNSTATSAPTTTTQGPGPAVTPVPQGSPSSSSQPDSSPSTATTDGGSSAPGSSSAQPSSSSAPPLTAGAILTTTNAAGGTVLSTLSLGSVVTTVNAAGVTIVSTVGGPARTMSSSNGPSSSGASTSKTSLSSSLVVQTTTLPNGQKSTVTSVAMVTAGVAGATPSGSAGVSGSGTATSTSNPGLQTAMATRTGAMKVELLCMVGGAMGMALLM